MVELSKKGVANMQRKEFERLPVSHHVTVRPITFAEISPVAEFAKRHLPSLRLDNLSNIERIVEIDSDAIQVFEAEGQLVGLYAMLFLSRQGLNALINDQFDGGNPAGEFIAGRSDRPVAVYTWFVACPGRAVTGFGNVAKFLRGERFAKADLYARPASPEGLRLMKGIGYRPVTLDSNGLYRYTRLCNRMPNLEQAA
jgi:hypothetical protein